MKDKFIFSYDRDNKLVVLENPEYFYNKEFDIGFKEKYSFYKLANFIYGDKEGSYSDKRAAFDLRGNGKLDYVLYELGINYDSDFAYNKFLKEKEKYLNIYQEALKKANQYMYEISTITIKDYFLTHIYSSIINISPISKDNYDFDKEIFYIDSNINGFVGDFKLSISSFNDEREFEFYVVNPSGSLSCPKNIRCTYYVHIPIDIAEKLANLQSSRGYTILYTMKLKSLGRIDMFDRLAVELEDLEIAFMDNNSNYYDLISNYEKSFNYMESNREYNPFEKNIIYKAKVLSPYADSKSN